jgi:hypothetical protein
MCSDGRKLKNCPETELSEAIGCSRQLVADKKVILGPDSSIVGWPTPDKLSNRKLVEEIEGAATAFADFVTPR